MLLILATAVALAGRSQAPPEVAAWADRLEKAYAHYERVDLAWGPDVEVGPVCPRPEDGLPPSISATRAPELAARWAADAAAVASACSALLHVGWELRADVKPVDRRVFSPASVRVIPAAPDVGAADMVARAAASGAVASKACQALVPAGDAVVELNLPCGSAAMMSYEVHDLVAALQADGLAVGPLVAWSDCGTMHFELRDLAWLAEDAAKEREFWGLPFPEARQRRPSRDEIP